MLKIASYSLRGHIVRVKLKCTCGKSRIFEVEEQGETYFFCSKCRVRKTLGELRREASTYWRGHEWVVDCEPDQRAKPRVHVDYDAELVIKATRYSPPYCGLRGRIVIMSESGALVLVEDFDEKYFQDITTTCRCAELTLTPPVDGLPLLLAGRVVGVRFRPEELPNCRIGVAFEGLSDTSIGQLQKHVGTHLEKSSSAE